jgi:hypothetical protein
MARLEGATIRRRFHMSKEDQRLVTRLPGTLTWISSMD